MPGGFVRSGADRVVLRVDEIERGVLMSLAEQVFEFVRPEDVDPDRDPLAALVGIDDDAEISEDPALARLFPDAYANDVDASLDFRRFTERSLREAKAAHARTVLESLQRSGSKVVVSSGEVASWLGFLNDARLAIGTRIDISEDNHDELAELPDEDPRSGMFHAYDWLTYLQETLVRTLMPDL